MAKNTYNGLELYRGPSLLDGGPVVVLLTLHSGNQKTGDMCQTWILRADLPPGQAIEQGADVSVCGMCAHRHALDGDCYVSPWRSGPNQVWHSWHRGNYPVAGERHLRRLRGRAIRFGSYGDPAAAPTAIWTRLARLASVITGYTHQPAALVEQGRRDLLDHCMVSVDSAEEARRYQAQGLRTYRVRYPGEALLEGEIACPYQQADDLQCIDCGLCHGATQAGKSIAIEAHGIKSKRYAVIASDAAHPQRRKRA